MSIIEQFLITQEQLFHLETPFFEKDKISNVYYIGMNYLYDNNLLLLSSISINSFFKYNIMHILHYLYNFSTINSLKYEIDIMKLYITQDNLYKVIVKTFWLKIVQRHFKKYYIQKCNILLKRKHPNMQIYSQLHGKYPFQIQNLPSINGLLSIYVKF